MQFTTDQVIAKNTKIILFALVLKEQVLLIITDKSLQAFNNMLMTVQTKFESLPSIINITQDELREDEELIQILASSISKKLKVSLIFSFNLNIILDQAIVSQMVQTCVEMINKKLQNKL